MTSDLTNLRARAEALLTTHAIARLEAEHRPSGIKARADFMRDAPVLIRDLLAAMPAEKPLTVGAGCRWCAAGYPFRSYPSCDGRRVHLSTDKTHAIGECEALPAEQPAPGGVIAWAHYRDGELSGFLRAAPEPRDGGGRSRFVPLVAAEPPAPLTVGAALSCYVVEFRHRDDWYQIRHRHGGFGLTECRWRHVRAPSWSSWGRSPPPASTTRDMPARIVPLAQADADPATRGAL